MDGRKRTGLRLAGIGRRPAGVVAVVLLLCVACDRGTDDLARKDPPWQPPTFADAKAFGAVELQPAGKLCGDSAQLAFSKAGQAFGFVLDLEAGAEIQLKTYSDKADVPPVDTVIALYGPADLNGFFGSTPVTFSDDAAGESGDAEVWAATKVRVPLTGSYFVYLSTFDGAGSGEAWISASEGDWICRVDCGDAIPLSTEEELVAAIPATPWTCNPASTPGPWPVTADLCAKVPILLQTSDVPTVGLPGACGTSAFLEINAAATVLEVDPALTGDIGIVATASIGGLEVPSRVAITPGTRFRLRPGSRIDTAHARVFQRLTFLAASDEPCADPAWRCEADKACYDRTIDGVFDPAYLYCLGCDRLPAEMCACRSGKLAAADGTACSIPLGEGATSVTGTCGTAICVLPADPACLSLRERWNALLGEPENRQCTQDSDCTIVGGNPTCEAMASLGDPSGTAVASVAASRFQALLDEFASDACEEYRSGEPKEADAAPALDLRCDGNICQATAWACSFGTPLALPFVADFDGGTDLGAAGWSIQTLGTSTATHWSVSTEGALGPDGHLVFEGTPDDDSVSSVALSSVIDASAAQADPYNKSDGVTVQWRMQYQHTEPGIPVSLRVGAVAKHASFLGAPILAEWADITDDIPYTLFSAQLPESLEFAPLLQVGFQADRGPSAVGTGRWSIDRVVVAAGKPNAFVKAKVYRCLGKDGWCLSADQQLIAEFDAGTGIPTLSMDSCEHWRVVLCQFDEDASGSIWSFVGFPSLTLDGAPLDAPGFIAAAAGVGQANGCETHKAAVQAVCGVPANLVDGYFYCTADVDPGCQAAHAGDYDVGFVVRDEFDPALTLHSPLESLLKVRLVVAGEAPKACVPADDCADANPCDADSCRDGFCRHSHYSIVPGCCHAPADRNPVTGVPWDEAAAQAFADAQCDDTNACTADSCDRGTFQCVSSEPLPGCCASAASCDDGDLCTVDTCDDNVCQHARIDRCCTAQADCDDQNACTNDTCVINSCRFLWDEALCCSSSAICNDQDPCTADTCGEDMKCRNTPISGCGPS